MGSFDFVTFFFFVAAVIIFLQLRSVLGRRTGNERPPYDPYSKRESAKAPVGADVKEDGNVVTLPRRNGQPQSEGGFEAVDAYAKPGTELNASLREIAAVDQSFDPKQFVEGAKTAYEMIVTAFADGNRKTLKNLLSREVYEGFVAAINERESKGEEVKSSFVGVEKAEIVQAELKASEAAVTIRLISQLISATYDKSGAVIDGDAESVGEVTDVWTFARDTRSRDPNWKLIATESDG
ncbi:Tim44/TimA family putative adaptor protein [Pararhizobium haloflavum]|uniref:Tim44/TimA family putative adaptor protein n=1 Tax=Pararhizobium haloflavum TaxID=2037914 RepID=UPI000C18C9D0|nr:Tim44/TimA family putative adaptor protein [Pararhizobium haloflavum]